MNNHNKKNILITGASGMLGAYLSKFFSDKYKVFATGNSIFKESHSNYMQFDLSRLDYKPLLKWSDPDLIIHCAALTNGNECESNPIIANNINGESVRRFIEQSSRNIKFIYISTDAVFGSDIHMATETDVKLPESTYGISKRLGEKILESSLIDYYILRTTIVGLNLNLNKTSFVDWIINSSLKKNNINLYEDVIFTPISIWDFANEINFILENEIDYGDYHISGGEIISKYNFGYLLLNELKLDSKFIRKGKIINEKSRAKRSFDQTLSCDKYLNITGRSLPSIKKTIKYIKKIYNERKN